MLPFYAISKILEYQDKRQEEKRRRQEEELAEIRKERERILAETLKQSLERGIDLVLNNPRLEQYPELREQIRKDIEDAMEASDR